LNNKLNYILGLISGLALAVILWVALAAPLGFLRQNTPLAPVSALDIDNISQKLNHIHQIIDTQYIGDFDLELALELMFAGFVYGVGDPYTVYMNPDNFVSFRESNQGAFVGIGVSITTDVYDNRILVISPFEGSPAFNAGILPRDKIIRVDGIEVFGGDGLSEAIRMMRGIEGTEVIVTIFREADGTTFDVPIIRELITVETVRSQMIGDVGYIRITQFDANTYEQFVLAYNNLLAQNIGGLVIDLRNNPGGLLHVVNNIADMLIPEGIITFTEFADGRREYSHSDARQIEIPLVVLINGGSASASELLAGAVRDTGVGEIVGTTSFGKGLVQNVFPLMDGSAVKVTVARYFTPAGISIHGEGITPTHYVEMPTELVRSINLAMLAVEDDVQLVEALSILENMRRP
jgi:carboxyl-terminal processing protease